MNTPPSKDAPRWQADAGVGVKLRTTNSSTPNALDCLTVYVIAGATRFPEARALAALLMPDLFADPAAQRVAALMMSDAPIQADPGHGLTRAERDRALHLAREAATSEYPHTRELAVHLLRVLAEQRFGPLLALQLEWAARELRAGTPVRFALSKVNQAARIALGVAPFDPFAGWEDAT